MKAKKLASLAISMAMALGVFVAPTASGVEETKVFATKTLYEENFEASTTGAVDSSVTTSGVVAAVSGTEVQEENGNKFMYVRSGRFTVCFNNEEVEKNMLIAEFDMKAGPNSPCYYGGYNYYFCMEDNTGVSSLRVFRHQNGNICTPGENLVMESANATQWCSYRFVYDIAAGRVTVYSALKGQPLEKRVEMDMENAATILANGLARVNIYGMSDTYYDNFKFSSGVTTEKVDSIIQKAEEELSAAKETDPIVLYSQEAIAALENTLTAQKEVLAAATSVADLTAVEGAVRKAYAEFIEAGTPMYPDKVVFKETLSNNTFDGDYNFAGSTVNVIADPLGEKGSVMQFNTNTRASTYVIPLTCCDYVIEESFLPKEILDNNCCVFDINDNDIQPDIDYIESYCEGYYKIGFDLRTIECTSEFENIPIRNLKNISKTGYSNVWLSKESLIKLTL